MVPSLRGKANDTLGRNGSQVGGLPSFAGAAIEKRVEIIFPCKRLCRYGS